MAAHTVPEVRPPGLGRPVYGPVDVREVVVGLRPLPAVVAPEVAHFQKEPLCRRHVEGNGFLLVQGPVQEAQRGRPPGYVDGDADHLADLVQEKRLPQDLRRDPLDAVDDHGVLAHEGFDEPTRLCLSRLQALGEVVKELGPLVFLEGGCQQVAVFLRRPIATQDRVQFFGFLGGQRLLDVDVLSVCGAPGGVDARFFHYAPPIGMQQEGGDHVLVPDPVPLGLGTEIPGRPHDVQHRDVFREVGLQAFPRVFQSIVGRELRFPIGLGEFHLDRADLGARVYPLVGPGGVAPAVLVGCPEIGLRDHPAAVQGQFYLGL
mmetsp:Transcript_9057/g.18995  ORF Transcript_9057/g.18995 Transcript_9057/m.18995 type:complete len:318 (-) Transcript_9057:629-1582(-)